MWAIVTANLAGTMNGKDDFENVSTTYVINAAVMLSEAKHL
jgi:hypothetical protein